MIYIKFKKASYDSFHLFTILYLVCAICSNSIFFSYEIMLVGTIWKGYCGNGKA